MSTRREFLQAASLGLLTPFVITGPSSAATPQDSGAGMDPATVFPLSVASGDPTSSGVVLWTRIHPDVWTGGEPLLLEVAADRLFMNMVLTGEAAAADFGADRDFTVRLDLDGSLESNCTYYYRFTYAQITSRVGRCRTLPAPDSSPESLRLGVLTCQDYTNGYYAALGHLARDRVDFVLHLGDFIYETAGDPRFQQLPYPDRRFELPSGQSAAMDLTDFRFLYQKYRSDPFLQQLMESHTILCIPDDHETANDCYWDYARDTLGAPDHPLSAGQPEGGDPQLLRGLKLAAQQAWSEYLPVRPRFDPAAEHPFDALQVYRRFRFGDLVDLFLTDERTYRSAPACGVAERTLTFGCEEQASASRTMLGDSQKDWFVNGVKQSPALWKVWANEVFLGQLNIGRAPGPQFFINLDAWDGYESERQEILAEFADAGVKNLVALTGDFHTYMASYLKLDYSKRLNFPGRNLVGVEFMTPAVTSATLIDYLTNLLSSADLESLKREAADASGGSPFLFENLVKLTNPHVHFFNSQEWGYSIVEFTRFSVYYAAFGIPKSDPAANAPRRLVRLIRVPVNQVRFQDIV